MARLAALAQSESPAFQWLLALYCPGPPGAALPAETEVPQLAAFLRSQGRTSLARLLTDPLPEGVALAAALDIGFGAAPALCAVRAGETHLFGSDAPFRYSVTLSRFWRGCGEWAPAQRNALLLLPAPPRTGSAASLFPESASVLAALPDPAQGLRLGGNPDNPMQDGMLHTAQLQLSLEEARLEGGPPLHLLVSENCLPNSLETAYQLHEEADFFAPLQTDIAEGTLEALTQALDPGYPPPREADQLLQRILNASASADFAQGVALGRLVQLQYTCMQLAAHAQAVWDDDRALQTAFLLASFQEEAEGSGHRDLFSLAQSLRFELHRLPYAALERIDPVALGQLTEKLAEILRLRQSQPSPFILPAGRPAEPRLPVYLPSQLPLPEFQLLRFARGGWSEFVQLLHDART